MMSGERSNLSNTFRFMREEQSDFAVTKQKTQENPDQNDTSGMSDANASYGSIKDAIDDTSDKFDCKIQTLPESLALQKVYNSDDFFLEKGQSFINAVP